MTRSVVGSVCESRKDPEFQFFSSYSTYRRSGLFASVAANVTSVLRMSSSFVLVRILASTPQSPFQTFSFGSQAISIVFNQNFVRLHSMVSY